MTDRVRPAEVPRLKRVIARLVAVVLLGYLLFLAYAMLNWPEEDDRALVEFLLEKATAAKAQQSPAALGSPAGTPSALPKKTQPAPHDELRSKDKPAGGTGTGGEPATHSSPK